MAVEDNRRGGALMAEISVQDYLGDNDTGHEDTRAANFECENPDPQPGCDPGTVNGLNRKEPPWRRRYLL